MRFKKGDKVRVKDSIAILGGMAKYVGKTTVILEDYDGHYDLEIDNDKWFWDDRSLEPVNPSCEFEYMEEIEVRDNTFYDWRVRKFIANVSILEYPFIVLTENEKTSVSYRYARKIQESKIDKIEIDVKINGKAVKLSDISDETLQKIRKLENTSKE